MKLQTKINIQKPNFQIDYSHKIIMLGSCFAENMGNRLFINKFNVLINPFGIQYNPMSISQGIKRVLNADKWQESELLLQDGQWHSLSHHGKFSGINKQEVCEKINISFDKMDNFLKTSDVVIFTFGTAWVYTYKQTRQIVSNCHKFHKDNFERYRLSINDIVSEYILLIDKIRTINPYVKIIFTVSPIRHWKDGANGNQLSKSVLLLAIDEIINKREDTHYFPSYEIMMDELRDYRFYAEDMLHPSMTAENYIWELFSQNYISQTALELIPKVEKIQKMISHRFLNTNKYAYIDFLSKILLEIERLENVHKNINFDKEKIEINTRINKIK